VLNTRRITALAILACLLALPVLGMAGADPCCANDSPCAPGGAPCQTLGPVPCCPMGHGGSGTTDSRASAPALQFALPGTRLLELGRTAPETGFDRLALRAAPRALRLSVVLRI
jgi:hypothetical protein